MWRYYLLAVRPESSDADFNWDEFADRNNNELLKNLGNFVNRALKFVYDRFDKQIPGIGSPAQEAERNLIASVLALRVPTAFTPAFSAQLN